MPRKAAKITLDSHRHLNPGSETGRAAPTTGHPPPPPGMKVPPPPPVRRALTKVAPGRPAAKPAAKAPSPAARAFKASPSKTAYRPKRGK